MNFDEVNLPFDLAGDYTIEKVGSKQVPIITTNNARETCTIAACITSDGNSILPLMIFKYKSAASKKKNKTPRTHPKKYDKGLKQLYQE